MTDKNELRAKVYGILKSFSTAMFVTLSADGQTKARPMHIALVDEEQGDIWFFTGKHANLAVEISARPDALLVCQNENSAYISVSGSARVIADKAKIQQLWKEPYKVWFPGGVEDPDIALIAMSPLEAEYWDQRGLNKLQYLFEAAKAYVKGEKPDTLDIDQHAKTAM